MEIDCATAGNKQQNDPFPTAVLLLLELLPGLGFISSGGRPTLPSQGSDGPSAEPHVMPVRMRGYLLKDTLPPVLSHHTPLTVS